MRPVEELAGVSVPALHLSPAQPAERIRLGAESGRLLLDPYPLTVEPFDASVAGRGLARTTFESVDDYRAALAGGGEETLRVTLAAR